MTTAMIADDEPIMLARLRTALAAAWPELVIVAECRNGVEALAAWQTHTPDVAFLDIRMPGKSGLEVAAAIGDGAHVVFVTAYDEHAIAAFRNGAADYLLKPVEILRLQETVQRLQRRIGELPASAPKDLTAMVKSLLEQAKPAQHLKWIRASIGNVTRLIHTDDILFFQSDMKYTRIVTKDSEAFVRTTIRELLDGLDRNVFWQVHRSTIVNAHAVDRAVREQPEKLVLHMRGNAEKLVVSRAFYSLFKQE
jgi:DNA-binding LytR/AlgR family response regulator